jgi:hypothetical protein
LERGDYTAMPGPDEVGVEEISWELAQHGDSNCAWAKKTQEDPKIKKKNFNGVNRNITSL